MLGTVNSRSSRNGGMGRIKQQNRAEKPENQPQIAVAKQLAHSITQSTHENLSIIFATANSAVQAADLICRQPLLSRNFCQPQECGLVLLQDWHCCDTGRMLRTGY